MWACGDCVAHILQVERLVSDGKVGPLRFPSWLCSWESHLTLWPSSLLDEVAQLDEDVQMEAEKGCFVLCSLLADARVLVYTHE